MCVHEALSSRRLVFPSSFATRRHAISHIGPVPHKQIGLHNSFTHALHKPSLLARFDSHGLGSLSLSPWVPYVIPRTPSMYLPPRFRSRVCQNVVGRVSASHPQNSPWGTCGLKDRTPSGLSLDTSEPSINQTGLTNICSKRTFRHSMDAN